MRTASTNNNISTRRSRFTVIDSANYDRPIRDMLCHNCKQRHQLIERKTDRKNLFCTNCGSLTPIRSVRHERGLAAPAIQLEQAAMVQSRDKFMRKPRGLTEKHNPLRDALEAKGMQVSESEWYEPV